MFRVTDKNVVEHLAIAFFHGSQRHIEWPEFSGYFFITFFMVRKINLMVRSIHIDLTFDILTAIVRECDSGSTMSTAWSGIGFGIC